MQNIWRKALDEAIKWAIPAACAALGLWLAEVPDDLKHALPPVALALAVLACILVVANMRREINGLKKIHAAAEENDKLIRSAFRAMLDDDMGKLYCSCVKQGYTTEDERRRYERLNKAYEGVDGNGEAKRRKDRFFALPTEEEWMAKHVGNQEESN